MKSRFSECGFCDVRTGVAIISAEFSGNGLAAFLGDDMDVVLGKCVSHVPPAPPGAASEQGAAATRWATEGGEILPWRIAIAADREGCESVHRARSRSRRRLLNARRV